MVKLELMRELFSGGRDIPVTNENRIRYIHREHGFDD